MKRFREKLTFQNPRIDLYGLRRKKKNRKVSRAGVWKRFRDSC